jgi:hypothetical protein
MMTGARNVNLINTCESVTMIKRLEKLAYGLFLFALSLSIIVASLFLIGLLAKIMGAS